MDIVKLVPGLRAETVGCTGVLLHVTPSRLPSEESNVSAILLLPVTAVVSTTTLVDPGAMTTAPSGAAPHTAIDALEAQFAKVVIVPKRPLGAHTVL